MTQPTFEQQLDAILAEIKTVLMRKHHDYGDGNLLRFGEFGILVRASDKLARIENLLNVTGQVAETRRDTWIDLAGYAIQAIRLGDSGNVEGER